MKKLITILMLVLCINSFAVTHFGNFSTPQVRKIVSNSVTVVRWAVVTVSDLITIYNKTDDAIKTEKFAYIDILPAVVAIANTSQWVPFAPEIRMVSGVLPSVFEYNIIKIDESADTDDGPVWSVKSDPGFWFSVEDE